MKKIPLSQGLEATVDDEDYRVLSLFKWHAKHLPKPYAYSGKGMCMHRTILGVPKGDSRVVDHIDGNSLNNCRSNLRACSQADNCFNRLKNTHSKNKYRNVNRFGSKFMVRFMKSGKWIYLGYFPDEEQARTALEKERGKYS